MAPALAHDIAAAHLQEAAARYFRSSPSPHAGPKRLNATLLPTGSLRRNERRAGQRIAGFAEGAWWVQDAAAALPARLLGDVRRQAACRSLRRAGRQDAQLAAAGARVTAVDDSTKRLKRLRENLARTGLTAEAVAADAAELEAGRGRSMPCCSMRPAPRPAPPPPSRCRLAQAADRCRPAWRSCRRDLLDARPLWSSRAARWSMPSVRCSRRKANGRSRPC